jgi:ketosteroid isomerase-like protein
MGMADAKEILALEDRRYAAMTGGDMKALEALVHDELVYTHSSGLVDNKSSWLESMRSGKTRYRKVVRADEKVRFFGDTALVTGRADIEAEIGGQPRSLKLRYLNAWVKAGGGWKFAAWQSGALP